ncbi:C40 family peptidase [Xenorhabdus griffiniae]|uniref:C40 family peptidase n=1 Tax=Xenorhabdus griffiniae TaxID=351672 RepID=A0ABY9XDH3_9GAMM|nr:C40 family peptidase [Xenorhabdus griffiniae]MBD1229269.1 C40 family peptidase [Xenorhabdus griffiniae]MBE8588898.1 C40 family peptidase [Xenorhabdus griffiniae]WMV70953.1 C40 family peptidase [Xenorhabdus griffiniae]WNH00629.1 C40 family peptidase [Xenorhabdus griffiniae]
MRKKIQDAIFAHAEREYPRECCGVIVQKSRVVKYFPCHNIALEPTEHFVLSPEDYAGAEDWGTVIGIVHSHPDATTQPSELDKAQCDALGVPWHIVSWPEGDFRTIQPRGELPLIGRPFVLGFTDCYGLIMDYYKQEHGIELPDYRVNYLWWEQGENRYIENWQSAGFVQVDIPQFGDVIIMQVQANVANHAGILLDGNMLLHHLYGHLSQRTPYGGYWRDRTVMILRHKNFMTN